MTLKFPRLNHQQGISSLVLVLFAVVILSSIMIAIYAMALVLNRQSTRFYTSQTAFFAAEGAMFETIERIKNYQPWPDLKVGDPSFDDSYKLGDTDITRIITLKNDDEGNPYYEIIINAYNRGSRRSLEANYAPSISGTTTTYENLDIALVLDWSQSMAPAIETLREVVAGEDGFIDQFSQIPGNNRLGLVIYTQEIVRQESLGSNFDSLRTIVSSDVLTPHSSGATNIDLAIRRGTQVLDESPRDKTYRAIVLFTDGVPNRADEGNYNPACRDNACVADITYWPIIGDEPSQIPTLGGIREYYGFYCTQKAFESAKEAKSRYELYSIFLNTSNTTPESCTDTFGRMLAIRISSEEDDISLRYILDRDPGPSPDYKYFKAAPNKAELSNIFSQVITTITTGTGGSIKYHEVDPVNP